MTRATSKASIPSLPKRKGLIKRVKEIARGIVLTDIGRAEVEA